VISINIKISLTIIDKRFEKRIRIGKAYQIKDIDIEKTEYEDIDTSGVSLEYQHAVHVDGARMVTVRTVRFYESDTDL